MNMINIEREQLYKRIESLEERLHQPTNVSLCTFASKNQPLIEIQIKSTQVNKLPI